jgi:hypothetical protein
MNVRYYYMAKGLASTSWLALEPQHVQCRLEELVARSYSRNILTVRATERSENRECATHRRAAS